MIKGGKSMGSAGRRIEEKREKITKQKRELRILRHHMQ